MAIYARDGFACVWCQGAGECLDHLWRPVAGKYDNRSASLVTSCMACNNRRTGRRLARWLRVLLGEGVDICAIVRRLRTQIRLAVDVARGRELLLDPAIVRARRQVGHVFRASGQHRKQPCPF